MFFFYFHQQHRRRHPAVAVNRLERCQPLLLGGLFLPCRSPQTRALCAAEADGAHSSFKKSLKNSRLKLSSKKAVAGPSISPIIRAPLTATTETTKPLKH